LDVTKTASKIRRGEFVREMGFLLVVFAPLETIFNPGVSS